MWLTDAGSPARWSCEDCEHDPRLRRHRGRCGGPLHAALPGVRVADDGALEVRGEDVVGGTRGTMQRSRFRTCPVALARTPAVAHALQVRRGRVDGYGPGVARGRPVEELVDLAGREVTALQAWQIERMEITDG